RAVQSKIKALGKKEKLEKLSGIKDLEFEFVPADFTGKTLIEARQISFSFEPGHSPLIDGLDLAVGKKDRIAVIGKNGKGKTTLLNLLAGELQPLAGTVTHHSQLRLAYFGQTNIQRLSPEKTVEEEILDAHTEYNRNTARTICGVMMFEGDMALKKVRVLSGGEKSRVLLGKLIVSPANLLLLDEPTNHLDMESVDSLLEAMDAFQGAVVIVTHSEMILHALATRLIVFDDDKMSVFEGTYRDFLERSGWKDEGESTACAKQNADKKENSASKKELRKIKAELIDNRSRVLVPLQSEISAVEKAITHLEQTMEQDTKALVKASARGDGESIRRLSMSIHVSRGEIDNLFDRLEALTSELDVKSREFEERLEALKDAAG
ncbi:MAG TPA: ATP-binding cassette domain-containing protein, partial [Thermodesulfovibrionales bacterium]|nr:ATP-binding cassette domain-containing protein [Thermodesulfovibrionales bacterium]